jgi:hypothetical protein
MISAAVRVDLEDLIDVSGLVANLGRALNAPSSARVEISTEGSVVYFACDTWEPLLRVRIEDALEALLGSTWRELVHLE